jgi:hypothetical protein
MRHRHVTPAALVLALLLPGLFISGRALAYWELIPRVEGGVTTETNPYNDLETESYDSATGAFADFRLDSTFRTTRDTITLVPQLRTLQYSGSEDALDDDDYSLSLNTSHQWDIASASLLLAYRDNGIRTNEFNTATPGQTVDDSQQTWSFDPSFNYVLSERNSLQFSGDLSDIQYDASPNSGYYDYRNTNIQATWIHTYSAQTSILLSANGGKFKATDPYSTAENITDSYGATAAVERKFTPTVTGTVTLGASHSTQDVSREPIPFPPFGSFCPAGFDQDDTGQCSISESSDNFIGGISLRQTSELMTTTIEYNQSQAPRSNGSSVVSDSFRLNFNRELSRRFNGSINLLYTSDSALGDLGRDDRVYYSAETTLRYRLTEYFSLYGTYAYTVNEDDANDGGVKQINNRLFFSLVYRGVGIRR